jgi:phospholipase A1
MKKTRLKFYSIIAPGLCAALIACSSAWADQGTECIARSILHDKEKRLLGDIRKQCKAADYARYYAEETMMLACLKNRINSTADTVSSQTMINECRDTIAKDQGIPEKFFALQKSRDNPFVILPLRQNYILPYTFNDNPNQEPYKLSGDEYLIDQQEAKLQISLQVPLTFSTVLTDHDGIFFGFTLKSFWQAYNDDASAPFRETNYRPELFYMTPLPIKSTSGIWIGRIGLEHESNGRSQYLSRSWNRAYVTLAYAKSNWGLAIQPWYRFSESEKEDDGDPATPPEPKGDDNPDIEDYMGYYEMTGAYRWNRMELTGLFRRNFDEGKGAIELGLSFPLWGRLRGYMQYFDGYGESMIDYNHRNQRIGLGLLLTDVL